METCNYQLGRESDVMLVTLTAELCKVLKAPEGETVAAFIFLGSKITATLKLKDTYSLEGKL